MGAVVPHIGRNNKHTSKILQTTSSSLDVWQVLDRSLPLFHIKSSHGLCVSRNLSIEFSSRKIHGYQPAYTAPKDCSLLTKKELHPPRRDHPRQSNRGENPPHLDGARKGPPGAMWRGYRISGDHHGHWILGVKWSKMRGKGQKQNGSKKIAERWGDVWVFLLFECAAFLFSKLLVALFCAWSGFVWKDLIERYVCQTMPEKSKSYVCDHCVMFCTA